MFVVRLTDSAAALLRLGPGISAAMVLTLLSPAGSQRWAPALDATASRFGCAPQASDSPAGC